MLDESWPNGKPVHDFSIPVNIKFCSICHRLAIISMSNYATPNSTPVWALGWVQTIESGTNWKVDFTSTYTICVLHRLTTITYNVIDERVIGISWLSSNIVGLKLKGVDMMLLVTSKAARNDSRLQQYMQEIGCWLYSDRRCPHIFLLAPQAAMTLITSKHHINVLGLFRSLSRLPCCNDCG